MCFSEAPMTVPNDTEPFTVEYARFAEGQERAFKLPAGPWKALKFSLTVSMICGLALLFGSDLVFFLASVVGFMSSLVALIAAIITIGRNLDDRLPSGMRLSGRLGLYGLIAAAALLGGNLLSCGVVNQRFRESILNGISGANLRGIALAVEAYRRDHGSIPSCQDLLATNSIVDRQLLHPADITGWQRMGTSHFVPSYVLLPPSSNTNANPRHILAYERQSWSIDTFRLWPVRLHTVVYNDTSLARLSASDLAAALAAQTQSLTEQP